MVHIIVVEPRTLGVYCPRVPRHSSGQEKEQDQDSGLGPGSLTYEVESEMSILFAGWFTKRVIVR